jgi:hypothetical protein
MTKVMERPGKGKIDPADFIGTMSPNSKAAKWLDDEVAKAKSGVTTQIVTLSPDLARVLLARNPGNRSISEAIVGNYARDMSNGAWKFNGEPIIVAIDGTLNDGQHRAMAVVLSGKSITAILIIGVERETRTTLDQGRIRTLGDYLSMDGHNDANNLAYAAKMLWQWQKFSLVSNSPQYRPTKGEMFALVERTPGLIRSLRDVTYFNIAAPGSRALMCFCHYVFGITAPRDNVTAFFHGLTSGENLPAESPILYARNRLLAEKSRLKVGERAELIFRAWNSYCRGESPRTIPLQGGEFPMVESP